MSSSWKAGVHHENSEHQIGLDRYSHLDISPLVACRSWWEHDRKYLSRHDYVRDDCLLLDSKMSHTETLVAFGWCCYRTLDIALR